MNYWNLIAMFLQAAPEEVALVKSIVDAIHGAHQTGTPKPTFVAVPPGAIALPIAAPATVGEVAQDLHGNIVQGVPGVKRDRDLKVEATPAPTA